MTSMLGISRGRPAAARLLIVAAAHVAVVWVIAGALNVYVTEDRPGPIKMINVADVPTPTTTPPPAIPNGVDPKTAVDIAQRVPLIDTNPIEDTGQSLTTVTEEFGGGASHIPVLLDARVDPAHPLSQPDYPAAAIRLGEEGIVILDLHVAADGHVLDAKIFRSSGHPRLDAAAVSEALRDWHLLPATRDGIAIDGWRRQRVNFQLQDNR